MNVLWLILVFVLCYRYSDSLITRNRLINTFRMRSSHSDEHFFSSRSFNSLGITTKIGYILDHLGLEFPSRIQALSYKPILSGKTCILGEQTGSGKTLAYLLPTLQRMMDSGVETNRNDEKNKLMSPHIVVFAPTTELSK